MKGGDAVVRRGDVVARVIEFYIPESYEPGTFWEDGEDWGKLLHFPLVRLAQEPWRELVAELQLWVDWR
jgi:hypothetical protein